ncbi:MAG: ATP-binding protein [Deltaproteobacteria bacterium]|nr:ATP-binding protein [Deltaproteobacteria bacterium]
MEEIVVISGKGGTGKTSVTASLAHLAKHAVITDCDVDAADLHLVVKGTLRESYDFISGHLATINNSECNSCGVCSRLCRFEAIKTTNDPDGKVTFHVEEALCEGCGVCVRFCPENAIAFNERHCGTYSISETANGPMVHAKLNTAAENSGKLVAEVRKKAKETAESENLDLIITDGPPGTGCAVIATLTGADKVLVVTEPTVSGKHDVERVIDLIKHFKMKAYLTVNKWDINESLTEEIEKAGANAGFLIPGRIRYDRGITKAQIEGISAVELNTPAGTDIKKIWEYISVD